MKWKARKSPILYSVIAAAIVFPLSGTVLSTPDSTNRSLSGKCNVFMVGKLATNDGSVINSQTAGTTRAWYHPPADYDAGAVRSLKCFNEYDRSFLDARYAPPVRAGHTIPIPEARHTYAYIEGDWWPLMNEHQVSIGETTLGGLRPELTPSENSDALLKVTDVTRVAVERSRTAREAVRIMGSLMEEHGFNPWALHSGEFISVADKDEIWAWEVIPVGPDWKKKSGEPGAAWCAMRIPDDMFAPSCNEPIISVIDLNDEDRFMASSNVKSLAARNGWWDPQSGEEFRWDVAYWGKAANGLRTWRALSLVAPSEKLKPHAERYPIPIKPDREISIQDIRRLYQDFYQGTEFDRTRGLAAGPFGCPWWPRGTGTPYGTIPDATGPSIVIQQGRDWLPDPIGGLMWIGLGGWGDACVYVPFYAGLTRLPKAYATGLKTQFSWDSAYWVFNLVANWARLHYSHMIKEIQTAQQALEKAAVSRIPGADEEAYRLYRENPARAVEFLNDFCAGNADEVLKKWRELAAVLITWYSHNSWFGGEIEVPDWWRKAVQEER